MKKIWILNICLVLIICGLLACSHLQNTKEAQIHNDTLTPEMEIPVDGENIDEQTENSNSEDANESDRSKDEKADEGVQTNEGGDDSEAIVTPEL